MLESSREMSPPRSRGKLLVNLAKSSTKEVFNENDETAGSNKPQDIPALDRSTDLDLHDSVGLQKTRCNSPFTYDELPENLSLESISPVIIELLDHSNIKISPMPNDTEIIPSTSSDAINLLFSSIDERRLQFVNDELNNNKDQTEIVTDFYRENFSKVSDEILADTNYENSTNVIDGNNLNENISSPIEESYPRPTIDEEHVETTANVFNSTNENNCINNNKDQTEIVTDIYREKNSKVSEEDKNEPLKILADTSYENRINAINDKNVNENISSPIEESHPRPTIDDQHVEATVNVINSANENNCINTEDPDYIPEINDDDSEQPSSSYNGRPKKGRKRKFVDQNSSIRKKKANNNEDYFSAKGKKVCAKEFNSSDCRCPLKCTEKLSIDQRKKEFEKIWSSGSYEARCAILQGSVIEVKKNRSYSIHSKRAFSRKYKICNTSVCKKAFLITLGISQSRIDVALKKYREQAPIDDKRGIKSGGRNAIDEEQLLQIKQFIESLPKYSSHYCRDSTSATFLAPNLNLSIIYDLYKEKYENFVSLSRFRLSFYKDFNLRFKKPQKDTCLRCDLYKANKTIATGEQLSSLETEHKAHLDHAYKLRDQMKKDLAAAKINDSIETLTFDLEKTHCLPRLPTSVVYYKRQLNLHNLGIHCGSDGKGYFHIWLEHEAGRGTQEVGSCLKKFISAHLKPNVTQLILWADSCGGQNRSIKMMLMLLHILHSHATLQKITIRFLQPGHTYLPNDSEFGDVECALKSQIRLYTAEDYISVMQNCRRKNKFVVTRLQKDDFKSVTPLQNIITNRKCDENKQKISWLSTFEIELRRDEPVKLFMKSKLEEEPQVTDISRGGKGRKQKSNFAIDLPILYPNGRELSNAKIQDLKELLKLIPTDAKGFYSFLRNAASSDFIDDTEGLGNSVDFDIEENCIED